MQPGRLCAHSAREGRSRALARYRTVRGVVHDNSTDNKSEESGRHLPPYTYLFLSSQWTAPVKRERVIRNIARNENARARARRVIRNFRFTSGTDVDVYLLLARQFPLFFRFIPHSRNTDLFSASRAIFRATRCARGLIYDEL